MSKFASRPPLPPSAPVRTTGQRTRTFQGGLGYVRDAKSDLFLLAVTNFVSEDTFYESAAVRDRRFAELVHAVTAEDPEWVARLVPYVRNDLHLRSVAVVLAAEYVKAGGPNGRRVVDSALQRADEPAEMLAYWRSTYGRKLPAAVKRGVADAAVRLYDEGALLRYDGERSDWRIADVIELVHPRPKAPWQSDLFRHAIDVRHGRAETTPTSLPRLAADKALRDVPEDLRREFINGPTWSAAGWSWERLSGWLPGGMDAAAWEAVIPSMGYMALLRNLRNFEEAGVSDEAKALVAEKISDPERVAKSKQLPIRFLSAFREVPSFYWAPALEKALDLSLANVPALPGRTLILVDQSGSMWRPLSGRSKRERWEVALLFGAALGKRAESADVIRYGSNYPYARTPYHEPTYLGRPLLRILTEDGRNLGGTFTWSTLAETYRGHDRVVILTDEQSHDTPDVAAMRAGSVPIYTFNLAGYGRASAPSGRDNLYTFGGLTDKAFDLLGLLDGRVRDAEWPHMVDR